MNGRTKLICIPYAGSSAHYYYKFKTMADSFFKTYAVELPGRGARMKEARIEDFSLALQDMTDQIVKALETRQEDYALFGHSLGAIFAYEISYELMKLNYKPPRHLFVSGQAPMDQMSITKHHSMDSPEFLEEIKTLGGMDGELLKNSAVFDFFLPIIFSDYRILYSYRYRTHEERLPCGIMAFYGEKDLYYPTEAMKFWDNHTNASYKGYQYPGGHFFLNDWLGDMVERINEILT